MPSEFLTSTEFDRWSRDHDGRMNRVLNGIELLTHNDAATGERLAVIETEMANVKLSAKSTSLKWGAGITTALTIIIQAALAAFGGSGGK